MLKNGLRDAVIEVSKSKYQTDFIIWSDKYGIYCEKNAEKELMPIMDKLLEALHNIANDAAKIDFYPAEKTESDLFYLYGAMAFTYAKEHYCKLPWPGMQKKYDGFKWRYVGNMETGTHHRTKIGIQRNTSLGSRGGYSHMVYTAITGMSFRQMMYNNYVNSCVDILCDGTTCDVDSAAAAIQDGYIVKRQDGSLFVTTPFFTKMQKEAFDTITDRYLAPLMPAYSEIVDRFIAGYKKLFPKHLSDDADRACQDMFLGLYETVIHYAQRTGAIKMPSLNCYCDVLIQFKEN